MFLTAVCVLFLIRFRCSLGGCLLEDGVAQDDAHRKYKGQLVHAPYIFSIWYGRYISWSIDSCQTKVSADQYHTTVSRAQV